MNFAHSILGANELRLLTAAPGANDAGGTLHFRISHVLRDAAPPYTAVSYTWGDGEATEVIYLNGHVFRIRTNLWSCLYYLSRYGKHAAWTHIWVDAICIDQTNDVERAAQVRLMDKTYNDAACVSVWLGLVPIPTVFTPFSLEGIKTADWEGFDWADSIAELANRPYWSRFWVIQEFLLGKQVQLFCSGNVIDSLGFRRILCSETGTELFSAAGDNFINNTAADSYNALPLTLGRHPDRHPEMMQPLYELLIQHRQSRCKDPRDRVFALLGLIRLDERAMLERFFPDYTLSEDHVVIITLAHLIQFRRKKITLDSEELFLGLGVPSKVRRRTLLTLADFDYIGAQGRSEFLHMMAWRERREEIELANHADVGGLPETYVPETPASGGGAWRVVFWISIALLAGVIWVKGGIA